MIELNMSNFGVGARLARCGNWRLMVPLPQIHGSILSTRQICDWEDKELCPRKTPSKTYKVASLDGMPDDELFQFCDAWPEWMWTNKNQSVDQKLKTSPKTKQPKHMNRNIKVKLGPVLPSLTGANKCRLRSKMYWQKCALVLPWKWCFDFKCLS